MLKKKCCENIRLMFLKPETVVTLVTEAKNEVCYQCYHCFQLKHKAWFFLHQFLVVGRLVRKLGILPHKVGEKLQKWAVFKVVVPFMERRIKKLMLTEG